MWSETEYMFNLGIDSTDVAVEHGLQARDTRGRDARDTKTRAGRPRHRDAGGCLCAERRLG